MGAAEALGGDTQDMLRGSFRIGEDVAVPEPDDAPSSRFKIGGTFRVVVSLVEMLAAIEFDRQLRRAVGEIDDVALVD